VVALACCFLLPLALVAKPELQSAFLQFGRTRALAVNTWATLHYRLKNPDAKPVTLTLRLIPEQGATAIFEDEVTLGAHRFLYGRELVTVAPCQKYRVDVYQQDKRLISFEMLAAYTDPTARCQAFFLDDNRDFEGVSELGKSKDLLADVSQTKVSAADAPTHWAGYDDSRVVAIGTPDFSLFSSDQYVALTEYVNRGGTLVFLVPGGTLAAAETPLADLLPVVPLHVRRVEDLPELDAWGAKSYVETAPRQPFANPDGIPFLESSPVGAGITTLSHGEFPVIRWRRVGLGRVGVVAVDPCARLAQQSGCFLAVWDHILTWAQSPYSLSYRENNTTVPKLMAQLTGHRIPGVAPISRLLFGYAALITLILLVGYARRRHATAWLTTAVLGILATSLVFLAAYHSNRQQARLSATILSLRAASPARTTGQAVISVQSRSDIRPTFVATDPETLLRNLPPVTRGMRKQTGEAPLLVHRADELSGTPDIAIRALKPRTFATVFTQPPLAPPAAALVLGTDGLNVAAGSVPGFLPADSELKAFAILPGGIRPVRLAGGQTEGLADNTNFLRLNPFLTDLSGLLSSGRFPSPALAFVHPWLPGRSRLPLDLANFVQQGYAVSFVPARLTIAAGPVQVPAELVRVAPHDSSTQAYLLNRELGTIRYAEQFLTFDAILPPWLLGLRPEQVELRLEATSPGGNIVTDVGLIPRPKKERHFVTAQNRRSPLWAQSLRPVESKGETHRFQNLPLGLFSPVTGRCAVIVRLSQKQYVKDPAMAERMNSWRFDRIQIRITGQLPEQREF
jgi:type II secretory pathway pseudopilin PulG